MQETIAAHYPGTKLIISEWNFGADESMNGALAIADVLGIYGREGVDAAAYWRNPPAAARATSRSRCTATTTARAARFGGVVVPATTSDDGRSAHSRRSTRTTGMMRVDARQPVDPDAAIDVGLDITGFTATGDAARYMYSPADPTASSPTRVGRVAGDAAGVVDHVLELASRDDAGLGSDASAVREERGQGAMGLKKNMAHLLRVPGADVGGDVPVPDHRPAQLGADAMGAFGYSVAFVGFFQLVAGLGTNALLIRDVARDRTMLSQLVYNAVLLKVATSIIVPVVGISFAYAIGNRGDRMTLIVLGFMAMAFATTAEVAFGALGAWRSSPSRRSSASSSSTSPTASACSPSSSARRHRLRRHRHVRRLRPARRQLRDAAAARAPTVPLRPQDHAAPAARWRAADDADGPQRDLRHRRRPDPRPITSDTEVGWYTVAYRWVGIPIFITTAVVTSYFPRFSAHGSPVTPDFSRYVNQAVRIVMLAAVPCSIGLGMVADDLVRLVYEPDFYPSISLIQILSFHIPLAAMDTVLATALIASNRQRRYLYVSLAAAALNPIACVLLIHWADSRYENGAIGAALVTVFTELFILVGALRLRPPGVLDWPATWNLGRILLAGGAMVPVLIVWGSLPLFVQVALGAATYPIASAAVPSRRHRRDPPAHRLVAARAPAPGAREDRLTETRCPTRTPPPPRSRRSSAPATGATRSPPPSPACCRATSRRSTSRSSTRAPTT